MTGVAARAMMALAVHCLGDRGRDWSLAMQAEYEAASADGRGLTFAFGCLTAAWRELPGHEEGRLAIAGHLLAFLLVLPMAALLLSSLLTGFPYSFLGGAAVGGVDALAAGQGPLLNEGNRSALPALAMLVLLLAGAQLRLAWLMLEQDWARAAATGMSIAAATVTLGILTSLAFDHHSWALGQAAALALELGAITALAMRHRRARLSASPLP